MSMSTHFHANISMLQSHSQAYLSDKVGLRLTQIYAYISNCAKSSWKSMPGLCDSSHKVSLRSYTQRTANSNARRPMQIVHNQVDRRFPNNELRTGNERKEKDAIEAYPHRFRYAYSTQTRKQTYTETSGRVGIRNEMRRNGYNVLSLCPSPALVFSSTMPKHRSLVSRYGYPLD